MSVLFYCILIVLLIPGAANYLARNYPRDQPASLQEFGNRTEDTASKSAVPPELPNFMMSLYQNFHRLETREGTELRSTPQQRSPSSPQADIIRSLAAKGKITNSFYICFKKNEKIQIKVLALH